VSTSIHTRPIPRELYGGVVSMLKLPSRKARQDSTYYIEQDLVGQINQITFDHSCRKCMHIIPLVENEDLKKLEEYCSDCGNIKDFTNLKDDVKNFKSHYQE